MWSKEDEAAAAADGWKLKEDHTGAFPLDFKKYPTQKVLTQHLHGLRRNEQVEHVPGTQGGMRRTGNDGLGARALREIDRAKIAKGIKQFYDVPGYFGASMGRREYGDPGDKPMKLFKVRLDQGYDDGGAYWGSRLNGESLYCLNGDGPDEQVQHFVDAKTRIHAFLKLRLEYPDLKLKNPIRKAFLEQFEKEIARGEREEDGTAIGRR